MKQTRRWLASLLVAVMVLCAIPMALAAEDDQKTADATAQTTAENGEKAPAEDTTAVPGEKEEEGKTEEPAAPKFTDVAATSPFAAAIDWAVGKEITLGKTEKDFTDVAADAEYADAVAWAVEKEITAGTGDGTTFAPENPCNRGQIVTFLYRQLAEKDAE